MKKPGIDAIAVLEWALIISLSVVLLTWAVGRIADLVARFS